MMLPKIIALLRSTIGLDVASVGVSLIRNAVKARVSASGLGDISQYAELLQSSEQELQSLIEEVVIPETFFFRYPESFAAMRRVVGEQFLFGSHKMRVLSVPCSTGEEPYSIAMTLLEAGLSLENFQIDGVDISARLLNIARRGIYGSNSFRGEGHKFPNQYFQQTEAGFRLGDSVRQGVNFRQENVIKERFGFGREAYEFIFCRNLLIYFDEEAQGQTLKSLRTLLTAGGLLFVGPAETSLLAQHGFFPVKLRMAFAFGKSKSAAFPQLAKLKESKVWSPPKVRLPKAHRQPVLAIPKRAEAKTLPQEKGVAPDLAVAEALADKGCLGEAAAICEGSLREQGPSARAFHLLGLIRDCVGDQFQANELYRKALYLEPDHYDALIHLALLNDKSGNRAAAKALKNRARRVLESTK